MASAYLVMLDFTVYLLEKRVTMKKQILIIIAALWICGCSTANSDSVASSLVGHWRWVRSTGGFAGHTITPDSAAASEKRLVFMINHGFLFYRADTVAASGIYGLNNRSSDLFIRYKSNQKLDPKDQQVIFEAPDTLILIDQCFDCYINTYVRQ